MILLAILAVWRITYLITEEYAPFDIAYKLRKLTYGWNWIDLECFYCTSIWVSGLLSVIYTLFGVLQIGEAILFAFAVSAGSILLDKILDWLDS